MRYNEEIDEDNFKENLSNEEAAIFNIIFVLLTNTRIQKKGINVFVLIQITRNAFQIQVETIQSFTL